MNTWVLLITENLARILSLIFLISTNVYLLRLKKNNLKDSLTWDVFVIGVSFLIMYIIFDITVENHLLISNTLSLLRDFALMLSGLTFVFIIHNHLLRKKVRKK